LIYTNLRRLGSTTAADNIKLSEKKSRIYTSLLACSKFFSWKGHKNRRAAVYWKLKRSQRWLARV